MNRGTFLALTAGLVGGTLADSPIEAPGGRTYFQAFRTAPFPDRSRAGGYTYDGKHYGFASHYDDSTVGIFVPDGISPVGDRLSYIVHFYGWNNDVRNVLARYRLREQLVRSGRNAILIVPQGPKDAPDSGDGKLELAKDGFRDFMNDVSGWLYAQGIVPSGGIGRIVLSAHSGGYGGAGGVLARGGMNEYVSDVLLFDAAYGYYRAFADWTGASPDHHLLSLFIADTSTGNAALMAMVQRLRPNIYVRLADTMTLAELQTRAPTFALTTDVAHDDLLQHDRWYALFLQATQLPARPGKLPELQSHR